MDRVGAGDFNRTERVFGRVIGLRKTDIVGVCAGLKEFFNHHGGAVETGVQQTLIGVCLRVVL